MGMSESQISMDHECNDAKQVKKDGIGQLWKMDLSRPIDDKITTLLHIEQ